MMKVKYVLTALAALSISAVICDDCLYQWQLWPTVDPTKFHYCDPETNQAAVGDCLEYHGFVMNETVTGCVPWAEWNDAYVCKTDVATITCEGDTYMQPHAVVNPQLFYLCEGPNLPPVQLECPLGRGFYANDLYLGCFPWDMWRNLTGCVI